jgi:HAD superfamily hydrolase (TIGR01509 family)
MNSSLGGIGGLIGSSEAMLLDFDGVLADSEPFFRNSWNAALEPWGHSIPEEDYWKYWSSLGEGINGEIRRHGLVSVDREIAAARQAEIYRDYVEKGVIPLFPGAADLLEELAEGPGWGGRPYCIASNTPAPLIRTVLERAGAPVPVVVGGEGLEKKPSPAIFLKAAQRLGATPSKTVVLEDSWKGIAAAGRGGFTALLVLNRYNGDLHIDSEFRVTGLHPVIESLSDDGIVCKGG